jgi:phosphotransferase system HPr-like phosphotransfer protein
MVSATITLSDQRNAISFQARSIMRLCQTFSSQITIKRGESRSFDAKSDAHFHEFTIERCPDINISVSGKDELKAMSILVDYFNHGSGI